MLRKAEIYQLTAAGLALVAGLLIYLLQRAPDSVYLFSLLSYSPTQRYQLLGSASQWLPSLIHTYAFVIFMLIALGNSAKNLLFCCILWVGVGCLFELGQHPAISVSLAAQIPEWFASIPLLENVKQYFLQGVFDVRDLAATLSGGMAAWFTVHLTTRYLRS